ncbi:MAG: YaiI/YqxD family protein [Oligoflexales bacterium]|nr:YaiI/YqxD family protein [Oligoflexales bacterium]
MRKCQIWVDNDACPRRIRDIVINAAIKRQVILELVANSYMSVLRSPFIKFSCVSGAFDAADDYIVNHVIAGDLVITADLPLADRVVAKNICAINPRGQLYTAETIKDRLATRNLSAELRSEYSSGGGAQTFNTQDVQRFANAFDKQLAILCKLNSELLSTV